MILLKEGVLCIYLWGNEGINLITHLQKFYATQLGPNPTLLLMANLPDGEIWRFWSKCRIVACCSGIRGLFPKGSDEMALKTVEK